MAEIEESMGIFTLAQPEKTVQKEPEPSHRQSQEKNLDSTIEKPETHPDDSSKLIYPDILVYSKRLKDPQSMGRNNAPLSTGPFNRFTVSRSAGVGE
jgi:hypothetical protein